MICSPAMTMWLTAEAVSRRQQKEESEMKKEEIKFYVAEITWLAYDNTALVANIMRGHDLDHDGREEEKECIGAVYLSVVDGMLHGDQQFVDHFNTHSERKLEIARVFEAVVSAILALENEEERN